ncbi:MAG: pyridoxal phosphate-dependent aminotransferase, partial [Chthoniobacterales bacterium]|nr:pyridoxal phosphate-dependent aminotransferase [Chthoniobacterales bacterium]
MSQHPRTMRSIYMEWAKLRSTARFNLATSGIISVPTAEFPRVDEALAITSPGGYGYEPLQERVAAHAGVSVDCVVAAAGTSMANHLAMAAVLNPGDEVLVEQPAYGPLLDVAEYLGARVKRIARRFDNDFVLDPAELEAVITNETRLVVLTNMHNPSGALIPGETLRVLGEIALLRGVHVLVDEVYLEMLFDLEVPWSFPIGQRLAWNDENPFIVTTSLTKAYGLSGLRCGWIIAAPKLARRIWLLDDLFAANAAHPAEQLSVVAFEHLSTFRERARQLLTANRPLLDAFLDSRADLECVRPPAGTV